MLETTYGTLRGPGRLVHIADQTGATIKGAVGTNLKRGSSFMPDQDRAFLSLRTNFCHYTDNHSLGEYVRDYTIHTNGIESVCSLLKRQIIGIHNWVSAKHLQRHLDEMTWRFNRRVMKVTGLMNDRFACVEGHLRHKDRSHGRRPEHRTAVRGRYRFRRSPQRFARVRPKEVAKNIEF
ncbi:transposase [Prosthecodimorpha staleyi]|nr:transposase [Prosthecodimorpha staleyi]